MSSGCGDVLSLADLQTAKKHQLFEAEVITGKQGGVAGGAVIDYATNQVTGQIQKTLPAVLRDAGFQPASFTFASGGTLGVNDANKAVLWPGPSGDGNYYAWKGGLPKTIPASSTPATTGGVGPTAWVAVSEAAFRADLAKTTGASLVGTTQGQTVQKFIDKNIPSVSIADFGAVGDWNETTQTGTDNTAFIQAAIDALAAMPNIRNGGIRELFIPQGNFMLKKVTIPSSFGFGFQLRGAGNFNTRLYMKPDVPTDSCILSQIEYNVFSDIELIGALKRNPAIADRSAVLLEVKPSSGAADCDVKINPSCAFGSAATLVKIHGRGFHCNGALMFFSGTALEIVADVTSWGTGNNTIQTGMRNYLLSNCRFDSVSVGVRVTGTNPEKDYITDLNFSGNDIYQMDRAFLGADATLQQSLFNGNSSVGSFAYGFIEGKRLVNVTVTNNKLVNYYDRSTNPTVDNQYMHGIINLTGSADRVLVAGNSMLWNTLQLVTVGAPSTGVMITGNLLEQSFLAGTSAVLFRGANCEHLTITNNTFWNATQPSIAVIPWSTPQTSPTVTYANNQASFPVTGDFLTYTPILRYGTTAVSLSGSRARYSVLNRTVTGSVQYTTGDSTSGSSGDEVNISVPLNPVSDSTLSTFSGSGRISFQVGAASQILRATVIPGAGVIFIKADGTSLKRSDITGAHGIFFDFSYKI